MSPLATGVSVGVGREIRLGFLARAPLFRGLTPGECAELEAMAVDRRAARREFFYRQGEPVAETGVLIAGRVKVSQSGAQGQDVILRLLGPAEMIGVSHLAPDGTHAGSAQALEASHALFWDRRELERQADRIPALQKNVLRILAERLRSMEERYRELATDRVAQRLSRALLRLHGQIGRPADDGVLIGLSREHLAQIVGATLFTVSRQLSAWEAQGLLEARREAVLVRGIGGLAAIAEQRQAPLSS